uniref:Uncharacterized protein n=1 Tax=Anguilla anguilla TaxID=7936 RepID=A0A0E9UJY1_ANGAN
MVLLAPDAQAHWVPKHERINGNEKKSHIFFCLGLVRV